MSGSRRRGSDRADEVVGVDHELRRLAGVEFGVPLRCLIEADRAGIDRLRDVYPVVEDGHHQPAVILHRRALSCREGKGFRPAGAQAERECSDLGGLFGGPGVSGDVKAWDSEGSAGGGDVHQGVQDGCRCFLRGSMAVSAGFEADGVDAAVDFGYSEELLDLVFRVAETDIDALATETAGLGEAVLVEVADDHYCCPEELRAGGGGESDGSGAGDVDGGSDTDSGGDAAVEAGGEDVGEHGQVEDFLHRLIPVGECEQVPVRVRDHDVLCLAADPAAHVDVAVGRSRSVRVDAEADSGFAFLAVLAPPAGDVEGHRAEVADLDCFHIAADFDDFAGDFVAEDEAFGGGGAAAHHVLVATADIGRDDFEDDAVRALASHAGGIDARAVSQGEGREVDIDDLHFSGSGVDDCSVLGHRFRLHSIVVKCWGTGRH